MVAFLAALFLMLKTCRVPVCPLRSKAVNGCLTARL